MEPKLIITAVEKDPNTDAYVLLYEIRFPRLDGNFAEVVGTAYVKQPIIIKNPSPEIGEPLE